MLIDEFLTRVADAKPAGKGYLAKCPAHPDDRASMSISEGDSGAIVVRCFAGCDAKDIVAALDLELKDLFPPREEPYRKPRRPSNASTASSDKQATYDYRTADGELLFQVVRTIDRKTGSKTFFQRRPKTGGGWVNGLGGIETVPYRLRELLASDANGIVFIAEGEKDVENLRKLDFVATCNPGGAGKWHPHHSAYLSGRSVVVLPDCDDPGRKHAAQVARSLQGTAAAIAILSLPGLAEKQDVSDWLSIADNTPERLMALALAAPPWQAAADLELPHVTDMGNSERFLAAHGDNVRFWGARSAWVVWEGGQWRIDDQGLAARLAKKTAKAIYDEATQVSEALKGGAEVTIGGQEAKDPSGDLSKWAKASQSGRALETMLKISQTERMITAEQMDSNPWLFTVGNGTIDLQTGKLRPSSRDDLCTKGSPVVYDEDASAPLWEAFLLRIMEGDEELVAFVKRAVGYSLTGDTSEQCLFFLYGLGQNGKSKFLGAIRELMGNGFSRTMDFADLDAKNIDAHSTRLARLRGSRFVTATEAEAGRRLAEVMVKQLTGEDVISARFMRQEAFEFMPQFKLWLAANHKPVIKGQDDGIWRRIKLIPFVAKISEAEKDLHLGPKLKAELPGILNWAVQGCLEWQRKGLKVPAIVDDATTEYREDQDHVGSFLAARCSLSLNAKVVSSELYGDYRVWSEMVGAHTWSLNALSRALGEKGFAKVLVAKKRGWRGLGLLPVHERDVFPRQEVANGEGQSDNVRSLGHPKSLF